MALLQSFDLYILSLFTKSFRTGLDVNLILKRYQTLSVIYSNLFTAFAIIIWASLDLYGFNNNSIGTILSSFPLIIISFCFLKKGNLEAATICVLGYYHLDIFVMSKIFGATLKSLCLVIAGPCCILLLSSSTKMYIVNTVLCVVQNIHLILDLNEEFRYTMNVGQSQQIFAMQVLSFMVLGFVSIVCFIQKQTETKLWKIAQSNYERAENINKEVVQAIESKDNFVSSLSHEIRNPLNAMKGSIDYLLSVIENPSHLRILENANTSSEVLLNLVNNILDAAKLKADKMELMFTETKPLELIQKSIMMYSSKLKEKEIGFQAFIDRNLPPTLWVDHARLMQILMNLFSNCVKFVGQRHGEINIFVSWCSGETKKESLLKPIKDYFGKENPSQELPFWRRGNSTLISSPSIFELNVKQTTSHYENLKQSVKHLKPKLLNDVMCTAEIEKDKSYFIWNTNSNVSSCLLNGENQAEGFLKVQVSDNGSGISPEHTSNLFSMFSKGSHNVYGSSGLGLWICKQLCEKMGGDITLYTEVNKGTSFVFYIPINNGNLMMTSPQEQSQSRNDRVKALVVDDFAYNRDIHKLLLEREGVQVSLANNGKEALEKYKEGRGKYDFIMMDVQMPEMDGFTSAKKIREWEEEKGWKKVDIYFVSGEYYDENEIGRELKSKGGMSETTGVRCLRKPIDVQIVQTLVEKLNIKRGSEVKTSMRNLRERDDLKNKKEN